MDLIDRSRTAEANQPPPLVDYDLFAADAALTEGAKREGATWAIPSFHEIGRKAGSAEAIAWGFDANRFAPILRTHDRYGLRIDEVEFHPSYHHLMNVAVSYGMHAAPWRDPRPGAHVARAAKFYMWSQVDAGHGCPISMTYAAVPALRTEPEVAGEWEPLLAAPVYDPGLRPLSEKRGVLCGMGMTERQGGSDVRSNTTRAQSVGRGGAREMYLLTGSKWFCSAPMCDAFLVLAQADEGLSCFLVPRVLPNGARNVFRIQRLKDKLGNRSNASSEVEFDGTSATMIGEPGRGVQTIIAMVNQTRLDCVIGSAAGMRQAVVQAIHHASHRRAFGKLLIDQPLMRNVLADLALESEAATTLMLRLACACDRSARDAQESHVQRVGTAVAKYWVCKRAAVHAGEALECLGGNGYVEEFIMPRLYREAPLNSIWEGSGNVNALDVLRVLVKSQAAAEAFFAEIEQAAGADRRLDAAAAALRQTIAANGETEAEWSARSIVERMALVLQASLLVRHAPSAVADGFCATRLDNEGGRAFGTLPTGADAEAILERALASR